MMIETFREYLSILIFGGKHQASFYNVLVLHKLYELCVIHGRDNFFSKLHTRQSDIISVFPPKFPFDSAEMSV